MKLQFIIGVFIGLACIQNISALVPCQNGDIRLIGGTTIYEGRVEVCWNGRWGTVCDDYWSSSDAVVACRQLGFPTTGAQALSFATFGRGTGPIYLDNLICTSNETRLVDCAHNGIANHNCLHSEDAGLRCPCSNGHIRLVGGTTAYEGRVEICWNRIWGTVCDDFWSRFDAIVACKQLGFPTTSVEVYKSAHFGQGTGPIYLDNLICNSTETKLVDCRHNGISVHNCNHSEDAGLRCQMPCTNGDIRLVGGKTAYEGRVEICWNKIWGTVCDDFWSQFDAIVACRQLGFPTTGVKVYKSAHFGQGTGPIHLDNLICNSTETKLVDCRHNGISVHNCKHSEDAGLRCQMPCTNGDIRLVGGTTEYEGRLEICWNNIWGTVCDDFWSRFDAIVACRQLGFPTTGVKVYKSAHFGQGTGPIHLDNLICNSTETKLVDCRHNGISVHNCNHSEDAGLRCQMPCTNGDIRLVGGTTEYEGRVEICWNRIWGSVCDDFWSLFDAIVACRQLGFPTTSVKVYKSAHFGQGTGPIHLDNLICNSTETKLVDCRHNGISVHNCKHSEDAGLRCQMPCTNGDIRLVGGTTEYEGRVEICWNNIWGTVCDDFWSRFDAIVACRQLGFPTTGVKVYKSAHFGQGTGPIHLDNLICNSTETKLVDCRHNGISVHNCNHSEDAGLRCQMPCTNGDIRLVGGTTEYEGRVEICWNNIWGTVCDDFWSRFDAIVACRQLGFPTTGVKVYKSAHFGQGTGPIHLDNLICNSTETKLVDCRHNGISVHNCNHSEDAGLRCQMPCTNGDIRLVDGKTAYEGRVEICWNRIWGSVCHDFWSQFDAIVACRQLGFPTTGVEVYKSAHFGQGTGPIHLDNLICNSTETKLVDCRHNGISVHNCKHSEDAGLRCQMPCTNGDIRLVGGTTEYEGRVEICWNKIWGTVCDDFWSWFDAIVACRQLGFPTTGVEVYKSAHFGQGTGPIHLDNLICNSTETKLVDCRHNGISVHNCNHSEDAGLRCQRPCTNGDIRLQGGTNRYEGRVEICNNNTWGTVCDDSWSTSDVRVVCRQLGFSPIGAIARSRAYFGRGTGAILLDQVACTGNETRLVDCQSNPLGVHNCGHHEDAGVTCRQFLG